MLLECIDKSRVLAFIDSNDKMYGTLYQDVPIISYNDYLNNYREYFIIISPAVSTSVNEGIIKRLQKDGVSRYFLLERCPMELPHYEDRLPFQDMLLEANVTNKKHHVAIAGINLFAILLYEYMRDAGYNVSLYDDSRQTDIIKDIKIDALYSFVNKDVAKCDKVLVVDRYLDKINAYAFENKIQFFRFPKLKRYGYKNIRRFANIHKGERCFVVATGPSLKIDDLNRLYYNNEISISVNTVYNCFNLTKWRPDYLVVTDTGALDIYYDDFLNVDVKYKFLSDRQYKLWHNVDRDDISLFHLFVEYYESEGPEFSGRMDIGAFYGGSVIYCALQLAVYMGFKEIYIIGADCGYKGDGREDNDHFIPNYFSKNGAKGSLIPDKMFAAYRVARKYAEEHGVKIFNATRGGTLEVFNRAGFEDLF